MIHRRERSLGEVACLRVPELPAASPSPQSLAQPGTAGGGEESPRDLTRQAPREGSSRGSEGNQEGELAGVIKPSSSASLLGTVALLSWAKMMLLWQLQPPRLATPEPPFTVYKAPAPLETLSLPPFSGLPINNISKDNLHVPVPCFTCIHSVKLPVSPRR